MVDRNQAPIDQPLQGLRILITRPEKQANDLCELIEISGGVAVRFPTLEIVPLDINPVVVDTFMVLDRFHWVIFISANAVKFAQKVYNIGSKISSHTQVATIGKATAKASVETGIRVDLIPAAPFNTESLLKASAMQNVKGLKCLVVRGKGGREVLGDCLRERGAKVNYVEVYQRLQPKTDISPLVESWQNKSINVIVVTSGEALHNLVEMMKPKAFYLLETTLMLVISSRLKAKALGMGITHVMITSEASDSGIYDVLCQINKFSTSSKQRGIERW